MRVVVALGGNALLRRGEVPDAAIQRRHLTGVVRQLAELAAGHEVLVVHGNGPQVGLLAVESEADPALTAPYPLGDLVAESQGLIGSWIQQELLDEECPAITLVTQVEVDGEDPAFEAPSKPIGAVYDEDTARRLAAAHGWTVRADGPGWRRVVASPEPVDVLGLDAASRLVRDGYVVVLGGGGGVPVRRIRDPLREPGWESVEAVVDKDLVAALIADRTRSDLLVVLTDVDGVLRDFGTDHASLLEQASADELDALPLAAGSMGPKARACARFVRGGRHRRAAIGRLEDLAYLVAGAAGTQVHSDHHPTKGTAMTEHLPRPTGGEAAIASDERPVVVAVDGSEGALAAVRYGAVEADLLGRPLRIVHVARDYLATVAMMPTAVPIATDALEAAGRAILREAAAMARGIVPDDRVTVALSIGERIGGILAAASEAHLVVLGDDRTPTLERITVGTVIGAVAARTPTPVVTVPPTWSDPHDRGLPRRVVLGVKDYDRIPPELLCAGLRLAQEHKATLELVHVWEVPATYGDMVGSMMDLTSWQEMVSRSLRAAAHVHAGDFPGVEIEAAARYGQAAHVLRELSADASLLLLARRAHAFPLGHFGSTGRALLRESCCPVEVLPIAEIGPPGHAG
jgi:carbamate kinase